MALDHAQDEWICVRNLTDAVSKLEAALHAEK
jgi:hypothetical protein